MFKRILSFEDLKNGTDSFSEIKDGDVFQIFHRGHDVKVVMTQEYFFNLVARLENAESATGRTTYNPEKLMTEFEDRMKKLNQVCKGPTNL